MYYNLNLKNIILLLLTNSFQKLLLLFLNNVLLYFFSSDFDFDFCFSNIFILNKFKLFLSFFVFFNIDLVLINYILVLYDFIIDFINHILNDDLYYDFYYILFTFYFIIIN
jgi:hypothetical protein